MIDERMHVSRDVCSHCGARHYIRIKYDDRRQDKEFCLSCNYFRDNGPFELTIDEYQALAGTTAIYEGQGSVLGLFYTAMGLAAEAAVSKVDLPTLG